jgi:hypothetical protein
MQLPPGLLELGAVHPRLRAALMPADIQH